jgi:hypothetical protein
MEASCADPPAPTVKPDIPTPSTPHFTLAYVDHSYDVPAKTKSTTDPYTGQVTTTTIPGYHVKNFTIDVTIKNQAYPATINHGHNSTLFYDIRAKGHFESDDMFWTAGDGMIEGARVVTSNSEFTIASIPVKGVTEGGAVDIKVQASLGYEYTYYYGLTPMCGWASADSAWSSIQTFTLPGTPPTSNPTVEPFQPTIGPTESSIPSNEINPALDTTSILIVVIVALVVVIAALVLMLSRKTRTPKPIINTLEGA